MKNIKFRGWDGENMLLPEDLTVAPKHRKWLGKKDVELMQWTGLKDKNGQPIFEGDIVHEDCTNPNVNWTYEVFYDKDEAKFWLRNEEEVYGQWNVYDDPAYVRWSLYEVIGNVWESPELIAK